MPDTSTHRQIANAKNALRSTGPRTDQGKARSSRNALKHGLTARDVVLPDEDPIAFDNQLQAWRHYYQPQDPAQLAMIERAVVSKWKLDRCNRVETRCLSLKVRRATLQYDLDQLSAAEALGRRLIADPLDRRSQPCANDPDFRAEVRSRKADNPAILVRQMEMTASGVDWLMKRWVELSELLDVHGFWHLPEQFRALRLLGKHADDALLDEVVQNVFFAGEVLHPDADDPECVNLCRACHEVTLEFSERPVHHVQLANLQARQAADAPTALAQIRALIDQELSRLDALKQSPLDRPARASAPERAMFDESHEAVLLRRYESAVEREFHRSISDLMKLRKEPAPESDQTPHDAPLPNEPIAEPSAEEEVASDDPASDGFSTADFGAMWPLDRPATPSCGVSGVKTAPRTTR